MSRHVFYSLDYAADRSRIELIRKLSGFVPNIEAKPAAWADLKRRGDFAVKMWLEQQLRGRSCLIVLIGAATASRPLVQQEIARARALKLGVLGVHVHALHDEKGRSGEKGKDPFADAQVRDVRVEDAYDPPFDDAKLAYRHIADNLERWVELAVAGRRAG